MSAARRIVFIAFTALSLSCGGGAAKQVGEACVATSQCASGLICDQVTKVCAMMGTQVDASQAADATPDDADVSDAPIDARVDAQTTIDAPMIDAPMIDAPMIDAPMIDAPMIDAPDIDAPVIDAPDEPDAQ